MLAVLDNAIECFQKYAGATDGKGTRLFLKVEEWILDRISDWPYSFERICEALRLDPDYIRRGLLRKKEFLIGTPKEMRYLTSGTRFSSARRIVNQQGSKGPTIASPVET